MKTYLFEHRVRHTVVAPSEAEARAKIVSDGELYADDFVLIDVTDAPNG